MKSKAVVVILLVLLVIVGPYHYSSDRFLPWMRYRSVSERYGFVRYNLTTTQTNDGKYLLGISSTKRIVRVLVPWFGDTVRSTMYMDGLGPPEGLTDVTGYDTNIISTSGGTLFPKQPGTTKLFARLTSGVDSIYVQVSREQCGLAIHPLKR